jgi:hypothetical protein
MAPPPSGGVEVGRLEAERWRWCTAWCERRGRGGLWARRVLKLRKEEAATRRRSPAARRWRRSGCRVWAPPAHAQG